MKQVAFLLVYAQASLRVMSPVTLAEKVDQEGKGLIPSSLGNFGHIDYGASMLGQVR